MDTRGIGRKRRMGVLQRPLYTAVARGASGLDFMSAAGDNSQLDSVKWKTKILIKSNIVRQAILLVKTSARFQEMEQEVMLPTNNRRCLR